MLPSSSRSSTKHKVRAHLLLVHSFVLFEQVGYKCFPSVHRTFLTVSFMSPLAHAAKELIVYGGVCVPCALIIVNERQDLASHSTLN